MEKNNLIGNPAYAEIAGELEKKLTDWQLRTGDPLLEGRDIRTPGTVVNRPECIEPDSQDPEDYL